MLGLVGLLGVIWTEERIVRGQRAATEEASLAEPFLPLSICSLLKSLRLVSISESDELDSPSTSRAT